VEIRVAIVVKRVKGRLYVYEQYRLGGRVVTRYIGPLEEMARVYELYKRGELGSIKPRNLRKLSKLIAEELSKKLGNTVVNHRAQNKQKTETKEEPNIRVAGPGGFEPPTTGLGGRRSILAELRAHVGPAVSVFPCL
jgi:hypothetical protein